MTAQDVGNIISVLLKGLLPALKIFGFTLLYAIPLGMVVALLKMSKLRAVSWLTNLYILIMRGTPLMLQIIVVYYAVPMLRLKTGDGLFGSLLNSFDIQSDSYMFRAVLTAFVLNYAAYFAEIFRGGIESIPKGLASS